MIADVRDFFIHRRRAAIEATVWSKLTEDQQRDEILAADALAADLVRGIAETVAAAGHDVITAKLGPTTLDGGMVKLTAKGMADDGTLLAINRVGDKTVKIVVVDTERYDHGDDAPLPEPDEPEMDLDGDDFEARTGIADEMDEPEDLHAEDEEPEPIMPDDDELRETDADQAEPEPEEALGEIDPVEHAMAAAVAGETASANPFPDGSRPAQTWAETFEEALGEIAEMEAEGAKAARAGKTKSDCPYEKGSDSEPFWMKGFNSEKAVMRKEAKEAAQADDEAAPTGDKIDTDPGAYANGRKAAEAGEALDMNPFHPETESVKHRHWREGWEAINGAEVDGEEAMA